MAFFVCDVLDIFNILIFFGNIINQKTRLDVNSLQNIFNSYSILDITDD